MDHCKNKLELELAKAMHTGDLRKAEALIERGADVNALVAIPGWSGERPLVRAVSNGWVDLCKKLIGIGASVDLADRYGATPLHIAAKWRSDEIFVLLLAAGADVNKADPKGQTALLRAAEAGYSKRCELLIERGADLQARCLCWRTALHYAAMKNKVDTCRTLIEAGLTMNDTPANASGYYLTPLQLAVYYSAPDVVRMAVEEFGEDIGQRSVDGRSLFDLSSANNADTEAASGTLGVILSLQTERALRSVMPDAGPARSLRTRGCPSL